MAGIAREVAAVTGTSFSIPAAGPDEAGPAAAHAVTVEIEDAELCPRYTARVIRGVKIGPSPAWLVERIMAAGTRPVNNVVDVTNYVMYELGQPLHAFDMNKLAQRDGTTAIVVRVAREGESIRTLDGQDRKLAPDTLLITDHSGPGALAGVLGGESTEVSDETTDILLESASFQTSSTSRTSRRLGLISESSLRFERGVDAEGAAAASDRAAALIAELAGGTVAPGIVDEYPGRKDPLRLALRANRTNALLGTSLSTSEIRTLLAPLGIVCAEADGNLECIIPSYRPDLVREVDLIEEVARLYGLERIESTLPGGRGRIGGLTAEQRFKSRLSAALRAAGLDEHVGFSFGDPDDLARMNWELASDELLVELINPMSEEHAVLRWTLVPSLLRAVSHNQRRGLPDVHLYELGTSFLTAEGRKQPKERLMVGGALAGAWTPKGWNVEGRELDFFDGKGVLESVLTTLGAGSWSVRAAERPWLQPGRTADVVVAGDVVGWIGEVAAGVLDAFDAAGPIVLFELSVSALRKAAARTATRYKEIPRYPAYELDVAFVVDEAVTAEKLAGAIRSAGGTLLESVRLFDVYRDAPGAAETAKRLPSGKKSMAFSLSYRSPDRTLSDADVRPVYEKLVRKVAATLGAEVRS
jgi:phenylalanyl-tRNA synthetase beta chain